MISDQEIINLVTARMQGKKILRRGKYALGAQDWRPFGKSDEWDFVGYQYMIAPDPRMLYAEIMPDGRHIQSSLKPFKPTNGGEIVEFREVQS